MGVRLPVDEDRPGRIFAEDEEVSIRNEELPIVDGVRASKEKESFHLRKVCPRPAGMSTLFLRFFFAKPIDKFGI